MELIFEYINDIINPQQKWEKIVKKNEWKLRKVPLEYLTQKMCNEAVENNYDVLCCVPDRFKTRRMCDKAFNTCSESIRDIPEQFITREMCLKALKDNITRIIPKSFYKDPEIIEMIRCKKDNGKCKNEGIENCRDCREAVCDYHGDYVDDDRDYFYCKNCDDS